MHRGPASSTLHPIIADTGQHHCCGSQELSALCQVADSPSRKTIEVKMEGISGKCARAYTGPGQWTVAQKWPYLPLHSIVVSL